ncbi:hypothetical protein [Paenibacillus tianjinensis]|uniref:Uncharacterized protein n=1 Tax=Paenibacillus tianjinensis TaxID=2810347 RepID=A0ABX7L7G7_9BACL|nr:hypothetical protein [Paenibacillus tianjinensis]QSF43271.1 hypothetical protein JRJ22_18565 [Paenibacillus tianjinensis]
MIVNNIFGKPTIIEGVGEIYPIKLMDYDRFQESSGVLYYNKQHFGKEYEKYDLLDLIVFGCGEDFIARLEILFSIVTKKQVIYYYNGENSYGFSIDEASHITKYNYDLVRNVIMKQNIMIEPKVYKNKIVAEWAAKAAAAKSKNGVKMTYEDMVSTVSVYTGKSYKELEEQTIYQLQSDFSRIGKMMEYTTTIAFMCAGDTKSKLNHFAEHVDLFRDPDDGLFVSKNKLSEAVN